MTQGVVVASARPEGVFDGVGDFAAALARALGETGLDAALVTAGEPDGFARLEPARGRHVIVHYVPPHFTGASAAAAGRWMAQAKRDGGHAVLVVHEYLPPRTTLRRRIASMLLARRLKDLIAQASAVVVTHGVARDDLAALGLTSSAHVIPVGSNVPVISPSPHGLTPSSPFVIFGQPASFAPALVRPVAADLAPLRPVVWLARSADEVRSWAQREGVGIDRVDVRPGRPAEEIADVLATAAAAIAPIVDGVSTRRTTVAAAIAQGLPVIGTDGPCTSQVLRDSGAFALSPVDDAQAFVEQARRVVADATLRQTMSNAAHRLHATLFSWSHIARSYRDLLEVS